MDYRVIKYQFVSISVLTLIMGFYQNCGVPKYGSHFDSPFEGSLIDPILPIINPIQGPIVPPPSSGQILGLDAKILSISDISSLDAGELVTLTVEVQNSGSLSWSPAGSFNLYVGLISPDGDISKFELSKMTEKKQALILNTNKKVGPNEKTLFHFVARVPSRAQGNKYNVFLRMLKFSEPSLQGNSEVMGSFFGMTKERLVQVN